MFLVGGNCNVLTMQVFLVQAKPKVWEARHSGQGTYTLVHLQPQPDAPPASTLDESIATSSQDDGFSPSRGVRCQYSSCDEETKKNSPRSGCVDALISRLVPDVLARLKGGDMATT